MVLIHNIPPVNDILYSKALKSLNDIPRWEIMSPVLWGIQSIQCLKTKVVAETTDWNQSTA